jgi:hypothetical protein
MVDVTFPFIILFGGPLAAWITALVRGHHGGRKALDILAAAICGPLATATWMSLAGRLFARGPDDPYMSPAWASLLADLLWFSPVIGGFIGVTAVAIGYRIAGYGPVRPQESWGEKVGDAIAIVGWVYAVIALTLTVAVVILAMSFGSTDILSPKLLYDLLVGPLFILVGWALARAFKTPEAQPAAPSPS